jgi:hypothetical protein
LNVFGIRSIVDIPADFDDTLGVAYTDDKGINRILLAPGTTHSGVYYLKHPINPKGTAIVLEGRYPSLWVIGKHKGYKAWQQVGMVIIARDNNLNDQLDIDYSKTETRDDLGINFHRAKKFGTTDSI